MVGRCLDQLEQTLGLICNVYTSRLKSNCFQSSVGASAARRCNSLTTEASARVVVSPKLRPSATSRSKRLMILPLRVFGKSGVLLPMPASANCVSFQYQPIPRVKDSVKDKLLNVVMSFSLAGIHIVRLIPLNANP
jgi:hypothetical protein